MIILGSGMFKYFWQVCLQKNIVQNTPTAVHTLEENNQKYVK